MLTLYQYIELNPVRACMVSDPEKVQPHDLYVQLSALHNQRLKAYRAFLDTQLNPSRIINVRPCTQKEIVLGNDTFKYQVAQFAGMKLKTGKKGRPKREP